MGKCRQRQKRNYFHYTRILSHYNKPTILSDLKIMPSSKKIYVIISLIGSSLSYLLAIEHNSMLNWGADSDTYWDLSTNILNNYAFEYTVDKDTYQTLSMTERLPLYPILLSLFRVIHDDLSVAFYLNYCIYSLYVFYIEKIGLLLLNNKKYLYIFILVATLNPSVIKNIQTISLDLLCTLLITALTYHILSIKKEPNKKIRNILIISSYTLACVFTKPNLLFYLIPLYFILVFNKNYILFIPVIILISGVTFWSYRNYTLTDFFLYTTQSGRMLYVEYVYFNKEEAQRINKDYFARALVNKDTSYNKAHVQTDRILVKETIEYCTFNKINCLKTFMSGIKSIITKTYYPMEYIIISKITGVHYDYRSDPPQINVNNLRKNEILILKFFTNLSSLYSNFLLFLTGLIILKLFKSKYQDDAMKAIAVSALMFIIGSAFFHGVYVGDRGLLPVLFIIFLYPLYGKILPPKYYFFPKKKYLNKTN